MKRYFFFLIILIAFINTIMAQSIGDKVYKELTIDNQIVYKWCELYSIKEYNEQGKETRYTNSMIDRINTYDYNGNKTYTKEIIFWSTPDVYETTYKYNNFGKVINEKSEKNGQNNTEIFYEYDSKGNLIHTKSDTQEEWNDYDDKNNIIHAKIKSKIENSNLKKETDSYYEYNEKGKLIHFQKIAYGKIEQDSIYIWDGEKTITYRKEIIFNDGKPAYYYEYKYEVNEKGILSHEIDNLPYYTGKDKDGNEMYIQKPVDIKYVNIYKDNVVMHYSFRKEENNNETEITEAVFWDKDRKTLKSETVYKIK